MRYTVDEKNEVRIYDDGAEFPFWYQPDYPNGDKFDSFEEAETWAKLAVASYQENEPFAPDGKGMPGRAKPTAEEIANYKANLNLL
jgi:hypothetical protein